MKGKVYISSEGGDFMENPNAKVTIRKVMGSSLGIGHAYTVYYNPHVNEHSSNDLQTVFGKKVDAVYILYTANSSFNFETARVNHIFATACSIAEADECMLKKARTLAEKTGCKNIEDLTLEDYSI